ncbi:MAG: preprotein translocase subunit SecG [Schleiferiaceae bacterium]|jgi:preprotein translocase subunit SecG|nr:preprotein translocase subunit SecG [Schleiferiaceae bacterium]
MMTLFIILIVISCLLLMLVVLVQNPKGGGLSSAFGGQGNQMLGGVKRSGDFLDKATWGLALSIFVLVLAINMYGGGSTEVQEDGSTIIEETQGIDAGSIDINQGLDNTAPTTPAEGEDLPEPVE